MATDRPPTGAPGPVPPSAYRDLDTRVAELQGRTRIARLAVLDALADALRSVLLRGGFDRADIDDVVGLTEALAELHARLHDDAVRDRYTAALFVGLATVGTAIAREVLHGRGRWGVMVVLGLAAVASAMWVIGVERRIAAVERMRAVLADVQRVVLARVQERVRVVTDRNEPENVADSESAAIPQSKRGEGSG